MISIGLIITFVGLGDKGFRTLELKLIGPSLVGCGAFFAILRVLFCTVPSCCRACCKCCRKKPDDTEELIYGTVRFLTIKVKKILKGSLDLIQSLSHSVKNQIIGRKVCLRCKCKTLLGVVNKLLKKKVC